MIDMNASKFVCRFVVNWLEWFSCLFAEVARFTDNALVIANVNGDAVSRCMKKSAVPKGIFVDRLSARSWRLSCLGSTGRNDI